MSKRSLVIIPTYNELDNIKNLIPELFSLNLPDLHILVVDDNSPDGTGDYIASIADSEPRINVLKRPAKMGLGTAYVAGFKYAIENKFDFIFEMDADFSHDPKEIPNFIKKMNEADLVIGSRYITGVNVINWPMRRLLLSYFANIYTRVITGMPVKDATGGFKCFKREVLESINLDNIKSNGYAFQIEMNFKAFRKGYKIAEIPIIFIDRQSGKSKMSKKIVREAIYRVWALRIRSILGRL
ncbi:MAG: polyprenol monophosphomannose synthase [Ignavibacteriaceae bacterium]|nr:polyprenol monophosphomannose synthase [Ignavibacteriaceae bacterium]